MNTFQRNIQRKWLVIARALRGNEELFRLLSLQFNLYNIINIRRNALESQ